MHGTNTWLNVIEQINLFSENFSWKKLNKSEDIVELINFRKDTVLAITWLPGSWKWWLTKKLGANLWIKLKNKSEDNSNEMELWMIHQETWNHFLYVILDCFFKEIWIKRYNEMLENKDNFLEMFSDDNKATSFILQYLNTHESFKYDWVYLKTDLERELSKALSSLYVNGREKWTITTTFLDWVNSFKIADMISNEIWNNKLKIAKIIITPNLWLAFQRIVKRDVKWNGKKKTKPLDIVTRFRLEEAIHLLENFTLPAIQDKDAYMYDFTHKTDHDLSLDEMKSVQKSIIKSSWDLFNENRWDDFDEYLLSYVTLLIKHFSNNS